MIYTNGDVVMYDQDWINDGYGQPRVGDDSGVVTHKAATVPGQPICGAKFPQRGDYTRQTRVKWKKVTCIDCLNLAPADIKKAMHVENFTQKDPATMSFQNYSELVEGMVGRKRGPHALMCSAYKFAMALANPDIEATETFVFTIREHGPWFVPFDFTKLIPMLLPDPATWDETRNYLVQQGYRVDLKEDKFKAAMFSQVSVRSVPAGTWVGGKVPIAVLTGPSALVSWLEDLVIMTNFHIQVATDLMKEGKSSDKLEITCNFPEEDTIVHATWKQCQWLIKRANHHGELRDYKVTVDTEKFRANVLTEMAEVRKKISSVFDVSLRSCTCMAMAAAVQDCFQIIFGTVITGTGWPVMEKKTMVGTVGHEHQKRHDAWANNPRPMVSERSRNHAGFEAIIDTFEDGTIPAAVLLPDTFGNVNEEFPWCSLAMNQNPKVMIRLDSGNHMAQIEDLTHVFLAECGKTLSSVATVILEDGYNATKIGKFFTYFQHLDLPLPKILIGIGGGWSGDQSLNPYRRNVVSAVYKLSEVETSTRTVAVCKTTKGKESIPGQPLVFEFYRDGVVIQVVTNSLAAHSWSQDGNILTHSHDSALNILPPKHVSVYIDHAMFT